MPGSRRSAQPSDQPICPRCHSKVFGREARLHRVRQAARPEPDCSEYRYPDDGLSPRPLRPPCRQSLWRPGRFQSGRFAPILRVPPANLGGYSDAKRFLHGTRWSCLTPGKTVGQFHLVEMQDCRSGKFIALVYGSWRACLAATQPSFEILTGSWHSNVTGVFVDAGSGADIGIILRG